MRRWSIPSIRKSPSFSHQFPIRPPSFQACLFPSFRAQGTSDVNSFIVVKVEVGERVEEEARVVAGVVEASKVDTVVPERHLRSMPGDPRRQRPLTGTEVENLSQSHPDSHLRGVQQVVERAEKCMERGMFLRCSSRSRNSVLTSRL